MHIIQCKFGGCGWQHGPHPGGSKCAQFPWKNPLCQSQGGTGPACSAKWSLQFYTTCPVPRNRPVCHAGIDVARVLPRNSPHFSYISSKIVLESFPHLHPVVFLQSIGLELFISSQTASDCKRPNYLLSQLTSRWARTSAYHLRCPMSSIIPGPMDVVTSTQMEHCFSLAHHWSSNLRFIFPNQHHISFPRHLSSFLDDMVDFPCSKIPNLDVPRIHRVPKSLESASIGLWNK